jgi:hypothetical protein
MNLFGLLYMWKYHEATPYIAILNKNDIFFHLQNQRTEGWNRCHLRWMVPVGGERVWRKGIGRVNIVQVLCTHVFIWKIIPDETIPWMVGGGDKGEWWTGWIQVWYIYTL